MKYHRQYKLNKDLPKYKNGWTFTWCGSRQKFFPNKVRTYGWEDKNIPDYTLDYESYGYSVDEIKDTEWFTPIGKELDFIPKFPSKNKLEEYIYLTPETRLVNDVDECRAINGLLDDKKFQDNLYEFYKNEYNKFYHITPCPVPKG